jgi:NADPH:quinone reductase-like Zn-dependent oxidoreductase
MTILRRFFLQLTLAAALSPLSSFFDCVQEQSKVPPLVDQVPPMLDHILLGCNNLQRGIDFVVGGLSSGKLKPIIAKTFKFDQIVEAHRYLESNQQIGKIVVTV